MSQSTRTLPERPDLDQLRRQARELQRATPGLRLAEAQRDLARQYGFASWARLKRYVEEKLGLRTKLDSFVDVALAGRLEEADRLLQEAPSLIQEPTVHALVGGDHPVPEDPNALFGPKGWPPLLYLCFSRYQDRLPQRAAIRSYAERLLAAGADPNSFWINPDFPEPPETCLYGASGLLNHPELTRLLLEAGANPNDNEALYHSTEHADHACLRLLLEAGGEIRGENHVAHMLDRDDVEGLRLMLSYYGEPDEKLHEALHHALIRRRSPEHLRLLVEYSRSPGRPREGVTPYVRARLLGLREQAEALAAMGADTSTTEAEAKAIRVVDGEVVPPFEVPESLAWVPAYAAQQGDVERLTRLLDAGFEPNPIAEWGITPLHWAAWNGEVSVARLLLDRGARVDIRDKHHNGTPLNWAVGGAAWKVRPEGDHVGTVAALLEAGAAAHCSAEWVLNLAKGLPEIDALLRGAGVGG